MSAGPILVWRVARLPAPACAPRRHSFSENRARDCTSASSWPLSEELVEAAEAGQDALLHLAVGPDVIDEKQVGAGTVGLGADEQSCAPVSPSLPPFHARNKDN